MIPYLKCMLIVAATVGLPPRVLPVIQSIEGGALGMVRPDNNGTADLGLMQVNSIWVPLLAARAGLSTWVTKQRLIENPCFNVAASALILRGYIAQTNGEILPAIGDYHSHTPARNTAYVTRAERQALKMFADSQP